MLGTYIFGNKSKQIAQDDQGRQEVVISGRDTIRLIVANQVEVRDGNIQTFPLGLDGTTRRRLRDFDIFVTNTHYKQSDAHRNLNMSFSIASAMQSANSTGSFSQFSDKGDLYNWVTEARIAYSNMLRYQTVWPSRTSREARNARNVALFNQVLKRADINFYNNRSILTEIVSDRDAFIKDIKAQFIHSSEGVDNLYLKILDYPEEPTQEEIDDMRGSISIVFVGVF